MIHNLHPYKALVNRLGAANVAHLQLTLAVGQDQLPLILAERGLTQAEHGAPANEILENGLELVLAKTGSGDHVLIAGAIADNSDDPFYGVEAVARVGVPLPLNGTASFYGGVPTQTVTTTTAAQTKAEALTRTVPLDLGRVPKRTLDVGGPVYDQSVIDDSDALWDAGVDTHWAAFSAWLSDAAVSAFLEEVYALHGSGTLTLTSGKNAFVGKPPPTTGGYVFSGGAAYFDFPCFRPDSWTSVEYLKDRPEGSDRTGRHRCAMTIRINSYQQGTMLVARLLHREGSSERHRVKSKIRTFVSGDVPHWLPQVTRTSSVSGFAVAPAAMSDKRYPAPPAILLGSDEPVLAALVNGAVAVPPLQIANTIADSPYVWAVRLKWKLLAWPHPSSSWVANLGPDIAAAKATNHLWAIEATGEPHLACESLHQSFPKEVVSGVYRSMIERKTDWAVGVKEAKLAEMDAFDDDKTPGVSVVDVAFARGWRVPAAALEVLAVEQIVRAPALGTTMRQVVLDADDTFGSVANRMEKLSKLGPISGYAYLTAVSGGYLTGTAAAGLPADAVATALSYPAGATLTITPTQVTLSNGHPSMPVSAYFTLVGDAAAQAIMRDTLRLLAAGCKFYYYDGVSYDSRTTVPTGPMLAVFAYGLLPLAHRSAARVKVVTDYLEQHGVTGLVRDVAHPALMHLLPWQHKSSEVTGQIAFNLCAEGAERLHTAFWLTGGQAIMGQRPRLAADGITVTTEADPVVLQDATFFPIP